jgi:DNA polymerase-3 subunit delta
MHYRKARELIAMGRIGPLYLFSGPEDYLKKELLQEILTGLERKGKPFYLEKRDGAELKFNNLLRETKQVTVFSNGRLLWVENPSFLMASGKKASTGGKKQAGNKVDEKEFAALLQGKLENEIVIFSVPAVDRRRKLVKMLEGADALIEFPPLKGAALLRWIKNEFDFLGKQADDEALHELVGRVGEDLYLVKQEIEKITIYLSEGKKVTKSLVESLVPENRQVNIFNLVDAVGSKNAESAILHLHKMLKQNEPPLLILAMVTRQFRLLYQVLLMQEKKMTLREIASSLRLPPFSVEGLFRQAGRYSVEELSSIMVNLKKTDLQIKKGFRRQDEALQQLLLQLTIANGA